MISSLHIDASYNTNIEHWIKTCHWCALTNDCDGFHFQTMFAIKDYSTKSKTTLHLVPEYALLLVCQNICVVKLEISKNSINLRDGVHIWHVSNVALKSLTYVSVLVPQKFFLSRHCEMSNLNFKLSIIHLSLSIIHFKLSIIHFRLHNPHFDLEV